MAKKPAPKKTVETLTHDADKRKNIPTAEFQSVVKQDDQHPVRVAYERRNRDLDPQLVGAARTKKTGAISSYTRRRFTSRRRCIRRC
jgi:hypothetical protein